jgi:hypothetical protein
VLKRPFTALAALGKGEDALRFLGGGSSHKPRGG